MSSTFTAGSQPRVAAFMIGVLAGSLLGGVLAGLLAPLRGNAVQPTVGAQTGGTSAGVL